MCGIAGTYNYKSKVHSTAEKDIRGMLSVIKHRGPDQSGMYKDENFAMGSVRLSIMDILAGQQPLCDESGRYWIVYNGEVFNADELQHGLEQKGVKFKSHCDTEVVVQMYARHGADCLKYFNGQFAFCIWDSQKRELFLARDRVGICPLFYWQHNQSFAFCSEIKGLFTLDEIPKSISKKGVSQIFTFWTTLSYHTPFEEIFQLPPGHFMKVKGSEIKIEKYWSLDYATNGDQYSGTKEDAAEQLEYLLSDAVQIRMKADVPVGAYLSGGLDSSVTTSFINQLKPKSLNTFSIGFKDRQFDETLYQIEASNYFQTNHTAFECTSDEIAEQFSNTIWHTEFPILRTSPVPMMLLSKKVRENNLKVVITGEGADEMLAGYNIFKEAKIRRFWAHQPQSVCRPKLLSRLYPYLPLMKMENNSLAIKMFFGYKLSETDDPLYSHLLRWHNTSRINSFFSRDLQESIINYNPFDELRKGLPEDFLSWSQLAKSQYLETTIFMSNYLLSSQGERMAMANSVEGRYPFLDHRVIEFCNKLPDRFKLNGLNEKFLLKKVSVGRIPASITARPKQPYRAPITSIFLNSDYSCFIKDVLSDSELKKSQLFDPAKVNAFISKLDYEKNISEVDQMAVTGMVSSQLLHRMFIEEPVRIEKDNLQDLRVMS